MQMENEMKNRLFVIILITVLFSSQVRAASPFTVPLWPENPPGALGKADKDLPAITVYLPDNAQPARPVVIVCPGGGYEHLTMGKEGHEVARWLNTLGIAGVVLKYRLPGDGYRHPIPLRDAQRAIRLVRSKSAEWGLDTARVGILGFSAGGHLASTVGTHFLDTGDLRADGIDSLNSRPNIMVLIYPVITMKTLTHMGSRNNLIGTNPDSALVEYLSNETRVTSGTPPVFFVHADDDKAVPSENSISFYTALHKAGVPVEMHIYREGGHGFGMGKNKSVASETWHLRCAEWLGANGWIP